MAEMTKTFPVFDCDAHINDPMEIWEQYVPAKDKELVMNSYWQFREYAPNVLLNGRKMSWGGFKLGNNVPNPITSAGPGMTKAIIRTLRSIDLTPQQIDYLDHKGAYYAKDRIRDLDLMGIDQVLVIPTELIQHLPFIENHWGAAAMCRA
ncbi:MAG: hypothetical protein HYX97_01080, partial [Chloroflexi bacterium]|nr:hypothetical protein [Chloroflexota bacterium]